MSSVANVAALLTMAGMCLRSIAASTQIHGNEDWLSTVQKQPLGKAKASPGCSNSGISRWTGNSSSTSYEGWVPITVMDFVPVNRSFWIQVPDGVGTGTTAVPLLIALHGQGGTASGYAQDSSFGQLGSILSYISVYPQGLDDAVPGGVDMGTGWNVGTAGDEQTCLSDVVLTDCYASCLLRGKCGNCNWSSCYNDKLFVQNMIQAVAEVLCIDLTRVYVTGASNGGMMAHYLAQEMTGQFAAVAPWFGLPLLGYALGAEFDLIRQYQKSRQTAMLQLHGRQDQIMPVKGGISGGALPGWIYEPLNKVQQGWAAVHGCNTKATPVSTYWDGGASKFACFEYADCKSNRQIMRCLYDGVHGQVPADGVADQVTVWFLLQFRLDAQSAKSPGVVV